MSTPAHPGIRGPKAVKLAPRVLLDAALEVFARDGLQSASLRAIARQAGCDPALIYYHFENKEAMFQALLQDRFAPLVEDLRRLADAGDRRGTAEKLWAILGVFHARVGASGGFRSMVRGELVRGAENIRESMAGWMAQAQKAILEVLEEGRRRGDLRPDLDPNLAAFFLVRMEMEILDRVPALSPRPPGQPPGPALPEAERAWFDLFWRGASARPEQPLPPLPPFADPRLGPSQ